MPDDSSEQFVRNTKEQIRDGNIQNALEALTAYLSQASDELQNDATLLAARYERLHREEISGTLSRERAQADQNRLISNLLRFLDKLPKTIGRAVQPRSSASSQAPQIAAARADRQELWLPLLHAAQDLRETLRNLMELYQTPGSRWDRHGWNDSRGIWRPLPLEARDFQELYLLDFNEPPIEDFYSRPINPGQQRRNEDAVQRVRARVHELNRATVAMYKMAVYLGYSRKIRRELSHRQLPLPAKTQIEIVECLEGVRKALNGHTGAGFVDDLQDLLGESVWEAGDVIGYYNFRERIFSAVGWEQFNELFRFFTHFHYKVDYEVAETVDALGVLCATLESVQAPVFPGEYQLLQDRFFRKLSKGQRLAVLQKLGLIQIEWPARPSHTLERRLLESLKDVGRLAELEAVIDALELDEENGQS